VLVWGLLPAGCDATIFPIDCLEAKDCYGKGRSAEPQGGLMNLDTQSTGTFQCGMGAAVPAATRRIDDSAIPSD